MDTTVYVAKIGKTVGLKGELKFHIDTDFENQFSKDKTFLLKNNQTITIEYYNKKRGTIKFIGFDDIDNAKRLTNQELFSTIEQTKKECVLDKEQYFWFDIIGCKIIEDDLVLGIVKDIDRFASSDYLKISTDSNLIKKNLPKEFLLPYIKNQFISKVDIEAKTLYVNGAKDILENS